MKGCLLAWVACTSSVVACGPSYNFEQPIFNESATKTPVPIMGERRPSERRRDFDYAALPLLRQEVGLAADVKLRLSGSPRADRGMTAVVTQADKRSFTESPWSAGAPAGYAPPVTCPATGESLAVSWFALDPRKKSERSWFMLELEGRLVAEECVTRTEKVSTVTASALVDDVLYAYRRCATPDCATEELVLIGPGLQWVSSTAPTLEGQTRPVVGTFSRLVVPVRPSQAASVLLHIDRTVLQRWASAAMVAGLESELGVWPEKTSLQLTVDVVWLAAEPHATGSLSLGLVDPRP